MSNLYDEWDEWDEVDYGDTWDEYDNYTDWEENDNPDHHDCYGYGVYSECSVEDSYDDYDDSYIIPGKQRLIDVATSYFQVDGYIFTYVEYDKSTNVIIVATNQEEHFAKVTPFSAIEEINGEYYVSSAASVSFTEVQRSIDRLREEFPYAAEEDIRFISSSIGTRVVYNGVQSYTYANQVICNSMAYAPLGATEYSHNYIKVQDLIEEEAGVGYTVDYNSQTKETFVRSEKGELYYVSVAQDAVFYNDERYVYSSSDVEIQALCTVSEWIIKHYDVAQADISVYSDRIIFTENGGKTYKILVNDLPEYIEYDYDNYIPVNANIDAVLDYRDVSAVPTNYYRVIAQIKSITALEATQDDVGLINLYGKSFYVPNAVRFNGWIYAKREDVIAALQCNFVDIDNYFKTCGFYYGTDDDGNSYSASQYKSKTMWLLSKVITVADRIRVNDTSGGNYLNLTTSTANIEEAVIAVFGVSASYLGARAVESKTIKSYIEDKLYIRKGRISLSGSNLYINGKSHAVSSLQSSFNSNTYYDKTKLLSAVQNLIPSVSIANVETVLNNGEDYAYIAGNKAKVTFNTSCLDHVAIGVQIGSETKWFHSTSPENSMSMTVNLHDAGECTLTVRGRTTMDPADVGVTISHSRDSQDTRVITVLHSIPNNMVYIIPYAQQQGCTVTDNDSNVIVKYQHASYSEPETCIYYRSLSSEKAYKRQVAYTASGLYMNKETFRMDMDLDIITNPHKDRDWYLEKRIWRLWYLGKSASVSSEMTDSSSKKYFEVSMNDIARKIYIEPTDNAFYASTYKSTDRPTIRLVNGHIVMPESFMYILFSSLSDVETYILSHYKINVPNENLKSKLNAMTLYDKDLNIECISLSKKENEVELMAVGDDTTYVNHAAVDNINSGMNTYRDVNLVNVFDNLNKKRQDLFNYDPVKHTVDFDGFEVDIPTLTLYPINKVNPTLEDYKAALFATEEDIKKADTYRRIVVYGGGYAGVCAAYKAAQYAWSLDGFDNFEIMLINPVPDSRLGGIATVGGQNFWDTRKWNGKFPYRGSIADVMGFNESKGEIEEDRYNVDEKANLLNRLLSKYNVNIFYQEDIAVNQSDVSAPVEQDSAGNILSITIKRIERNNNVVEYIGEPITISGDIFIDASEDGKLTKLAAHDSNGKSAYTRGRYDYPADTLNRLPENVTNYGDFNESTENGARMPAVTLMFKLKCTETIPIEARADVDVGGGVYDCGNTLFNNPDYKMYQFNEKYKDTRIMLKPVNSAWNGGTFDSDGKTEWWLNTLLIFGVDGSLHNRDDKNYEQVSDEELLSDKILKDENRLLSSDDAWRLGRAFLAEHATEILEVYEELGYTDAEFVTNDNGIVTGDILYVRETIHAVKDVDEIANGTENTNYEVTMHHCHYSYLDDEQDDADNPKSIGLNYYWSDIHPFMKSEYKNDDGDYIHGIQSYKKIRFDMGEELQGDSPIEPTYIPYSALTTQYVPNMLIPGYAVNASSFAWSEMRVFPNLCVLGDAAGIAAVSCLLSGYSAYDLQDIAGVRAILKHYNAIIDKDDI